MLQAVAEGASRTPDGAPVLRGEEVTLAALNAAAAALATGARAAFWLAAQRELPGGGTQAAQEWSARLSPPAAGRVVREALSTLGPRDASVAAAFAELAAARLGGNAPGATPDELLQVSVWMATHTCLDQSLIAV